MKQDQYQEKMIELLEDIRALIILSNFKEITALFDEMEAWEKFLYNLLDGTRSTRDIADRIPKARLTILNRLQKWKKLGIVKQGKQGIYKKILELESLGIEVQEVKKNGEK